MKRKTQKRRGGPDVDVGELKGGRGHQRHIGTLQTSIVCRLRIQIKLIKI
jgi:hypothetical protein